MTMEQWMGPQERRLLSELAVYLVRSCSRALHDRPAGAVLDIDDRRRWFVRAYHEWHLTPRVDLAGRSPYEVIAAERAASTEVAPRAAVEMYTDLASFDHGVPFAPNSRTAASGVRDADGNELPRGTETTNIDPEDPGDWQRLADRLFGSWLDDDLDRL
jgi:hypothetical protein